MLTALADDENWLVREDAHAVWSELFKEHFQQVSLVLRKWSKHSSPNLRRCVAIAVRSAGNLRKEEWAKPLISLLEPLLPDKTSYVRKNLPLRNRRRLTPLLSGFYFEAFMQMGS